VREPLAANLRDLGGVVDENVDATERFERPVDEPPNVRLATDVSIDDDRATPLIRDLLGDLERGVRIRPVPR
jgi:hypothetical protein